MTIYTVTAYSAWTKPQVFEYDNFVEASEAANELRDQQYKVEIVDNETGVEI